MIISGYIRMDGKKPLEKAENRIIYQEPPQGDYAAQYNDDIVQIDIDDYNHQTDVLEEPIHRNPRSDTVLAILDHHGINYNAVETDHGKHIIFKKPNGFTIDKNRINWYCPLGVRIEAKLNDHREIMRIRGKERKFIRGGFDNDSLDPLPAFLWPIQKSKVVIETGDRNNAFSSYVFTLSRHGLSTEQIVDTIRAINDFILDDPLPDEEINQILRPDTLEKLNQISEENDLKKMSHVDIGNEIIEHFNIIRANRQFYRYRGGIYIPADEEMIDHFIRIRHPAIKKCQKSEAMDYLKGMTFVEDHCPRPDLVNVRNGLLDLDNVTGKAVLIPHDPEIKRFTQFNAEYHPEAQCPILTTTLEKFFDGNKGMISLFSQMLGYLLMNSTIYQKCFFFVGPPSSGKSSILNMVTAFCGKEYVSTLSLKDLETRFRPAAIIGKVANINADLKNTPINASDIFKNIVGGDGITLEQKGKDAIENYVSTAKLIFGCNQYPDFSKDSQGVFRRVIVFPCNHVFSKDDPDYNPRIDHDLQTPEAMAALLNMAIDGYFSLQENKGFVLPPEVENAGDTFRAETDTVFRWVRDEEITEDYLTREPIRLKDGTGLYFQYCRFVNGEGEEPESQRNFTRALCNQFGLESKPKKFNGTNTQMLRKKQRK